MAQKINPRSLRSPQQLQSDTFFFSEKDYSKVWAVSHQLLNSILIWSQKNIVYKNTRKKKSQKRSFKKQKLLTFLNTRHYLSNVKGSYTLCPVFFKLQSQSFAKKYNPLKVLRKNKIVSKKLPGKFQMKPLKK